MQTAIVWFRGDLRLADNPAIARAVESAERVVPVFIHAPEEDGRWRPGSASDWWLHHSLKALHAALRERGSRLIVRRGASLDTLREFVGQTGANAVYWNRLYEPAVIARDHDIKAALRSEGIEAESFNAALLFEPGTIQTADQRPYRVFTPFWRRCLQALSVEPTTPPPAALPALDSRIDGVAVDTLELLPRIGWDAGFYDHWQPGERGALARLDKFLEQVDTYDDGRNRPDIGGTSRLSPHLHFGEIGPRQIVHVMRQHSAGVAQAGLIPGVESFVRELGWREFAHHLLFHFQNTPDEPLDARFSRFPWATDNDEQLRAWQRGRTGIPLVDAGMRELWQTGWMHNRVRMIVASLLTKNLRISWLEGARWFWDTLVDADLANNTLGWQWTAGCGADAAPFFRIFNPVLQTERFDPERRYIRRWVPELSDLPDRYIHKPWTASAAVLDAAGVRLGTDYPAPIVDLAESRREALAAFETIKSG